MALVGIQKYNYGWFPDALKVYEKILDYNNIEHIRLDVNEPDFWDKVKKLDLFIFLFYNISDLKKIANSILPVIQNYLNIKCFPDIATSWHYDDKIKEYYLLKQAGFPIADSYIFWNRESAFTWAETAEYPVVFKLAAGSQSRNVLLVKKKSSARKLIKKMFGKGINPTRISLNKFNRLREFSINKFINRTADKLQKIYKGRDINQLWEKHKNYILFQKFMPDNEYDTRVVVIGNRVFADRRYNRTNDFRASGSGKVDPDVSKIDRRFLEIALQISGKLKFQSMAYDFLYDENRNPVITEISYKYPCSSTSDLYPGYWDENFKWHEGYYWPQYFQLIDALEKPDLRQPDVINFEVKHKTKIENIKFYLKRYLKS